MVRIAVSQAAFEAVATTLPLGRVVYEAEFDAQGRRAIWVERIALDKLTTARGSICLASRMVRISTTEAAYAAICEALPLGSVASEPQLTARASAWSRSSHMSPTGWPTGAIDFSVLAERLAKLAEERSQPWWIR
jgi:hypothetical protein